jgi:transposase
MRVQRAPQAQELLGKSDLVMLTERVDEGALRIGQLVKMGLPEVLARPIPRHWTQRGISWGWTAVSWLASILTEGDHRTVSVAPSLKGMHHTLSHLTAQVIAPLDVRDDRLRHLLTHLRKPAAWHQSEPDLHTRSSAVYDVAPEVIRCDAPTVSGDHEVPADGLRQLGQSQDEPTRPQSTGMMGSLDPLGMPLSTDGWAGERADDGFYLPLIARIRHGWQTPGWLVVGDGPMRALATRADLAKPQAWYVSPWPLTGATAEAIDAWITPGVTQGERGA